MKCSACGAQGTATRHVKLSPQFPRRNHVRRGSSTPVQSLIIESLKEKEKPFLYLDTHSGAGRYQLSGEHAERTGEYLEGIGLLWQRDDLPEELAAYMSVVHNFNRSGTLRYSSRLAADRPPAAAPAGQNPPDRAAPERLPSEKASNRANKW
ncbi:23S rRNA (adenine(2030)-N(6))-methyltransferase RlmJ [Levilactobacillus brevis]